MQFIQPIKKPAREISLCQLLKFEKIYLKSGEIYQI